MNRTTRLVFALTLLGTLAAIAPSPLARAQEADKDKQPAPAAPAPAAPAAEAPAPAAAPAAPMVDSIKVLFDDKAKNDGELLLTFTPKGGAAKQIRVTIAQKMDRKDVAEDTAKELKVALGPGFKVDLYDADKIQIQGKDKAQFSLTVSSLTANGLSVRLK